LQELRTLVSPGIERAVNYRFYLGTRVGDKYLCVIVKVLGEDRFILTAYLTDRIKQGVRIWPRER
jgi:hypothetical protein